MTQFWVEERVTACEFKYASRSGGEEGVQRLAIHTNLRAMHKLAEHLMATFATPFKRDIETGDYKVEIRVKLTDRDEQEVFDDGVKLGISKERAARPYGLDDVYE